MVPLKFSPSLPGVPPDFAFRQFWPALGWTSARSVQGDFRAPAPVALAVPEVNALDHSPVTWQIDGSGVSAVRNVSAYRNLLVGAVSEANNDVLKINRTATDP
jgi:hypothetical protein